MGSHGENVRQLTTGDAFEAAPSVSPDGTHVAIDFFDGTDQGIYLGDSDGGNLKRLTSSPTVAAGGYDTLPDISPDGRSVVFERLDGVTHHFAVFIVSVSGTGLRQLTPWGIDAGSPQWSPDGSRIVFNTNASGASAIPTDLYTTNAYGGEVTRLTRNIVGGEAALNATWSPDGQQIAFVHAAPLDTSFDIKLLNLSSGKTTTIYTAPPNTFPHHLRWGSTPP